LKVKISQKSKTFENKNLKHKPGLLRLIQQEYPGFVCVDTTQTKVFKLQLQSIQKAGFESLKNII